MNQVERLLVLRLVLPYVPKPQSLRRVSKCLLSDFRSTTTRVAWLLNNREPAEALSVASTKGWVGAVRIIIAKHATTIGAYSRSVALSYAMLHRKADVMRVLLEKGCPMIMWPQFLPLATAVQKGRPDMAEILLNAGANPNIRVLSHATDSYVPGILYFAIVSRPEYYDPGSPMQRSLLQQLISAGLDVKDRRAAQDVLNAIRTNEGVDLSVLLFLIEEGLDVRFVDHDGTTLLLSLLIGSEMNPKRRVNNFEIIRSVLSIGIRDAGGVALFYAVHNCDLEAVLLLLNYRANEFHDVVAAGLVAQNHYNLSIERALHHSIRNWA